MPANTNNQLKKHMTRSELRLFKPVIEGDLGNLKEAQLKKKISESRAAVLRYKAKQDIKKTGLFRSLATKLNRQLKKLQSRKLRNEDLHFQDADPITAQRTRLQSIHRSRKDASTKAPIEAKHWEKTAIKRMSGYQGSLTRQRQGAKDHRGED